MHLKPCYRCPHHEGCEIKANVLAKIRGLKLTSARIKCDLWYKDFPGGQRVSFDLAEWDGYGDSDWSEYEGTVMRPHKDRLLVWLDQPTERGRNPIAIRADKMRKEEGSVKLCPECQQPEGTKPLKRGDNEPFQCNRCDSICDRCQGLSACYTGKCEKCDASGRYDYEADKPLPREGTTDGPQRPV